MYLLFSRKGSSSEATGRGDREDVRHAPPRPLGAPLRLGPLAVGRGANIQVDTRLIME